MNTLQRIVKNSTIMLVAQVISYLLSFFYMMYSARYLGPASFGILSFASAFTGIFAVCADLGLQTFTVREVARDKSLTSKYRANISLMKIILAAITFGLIALTINLMGYPEETIKVVYLLALVIIFQSFTIIFYSFFQAFERMEYQGIGQMLSAALMFCGTMFAIKYSLNVVGFASLYVIASIIVLGYSHIVMKLKFSNQASVSVTKALEFDWSFWKLTIKQSLPFFLSAFVSIIAFRIDTVMLSMMKGDAVVGWYSAAHKFIEVSLFIPAVIGASIYPVLSRFYISSQESLKFAYQKLFKYLVILGLPIAIGTTLLADRMIMLIYRDGFTQSIVALQILIWTVPIIFLTSISATVLISINRQTLVLKTSLLCMILNVAGNMLLIPRYSYNGSAIATVATAFLAFLLYLYFCSNLICKVPIHKFIMKPLLASLIMGLFIFFVSEISLPLLVCAAIFIYFGILFLLKAFSKEDINLFKRAGGRK